MRTDIATTVEDFNDPNRILIFDTTLRDGEQSPGATMTIDEKCEIARKLETLGVDIIEAGFPIASEGDFAAVKKIAEQSQRARIAGLARSVKRDIDRVAEAVAPAGDRGRIHLFLATSAIHREFKFGKAKDEILKIAVEHVAYAKSLCQDIEFSPRGRQPYGTRIFGRRGAGSDRGGRNHSQYSGYRWLCLPARLCRFN